MWVFNSRKEVLHSELVTLDFFLQAQQKLIRLPIVNMSSIELGYSNDPKFSDR